MHGQDRNILMSNEATALLAKLDGEFVEYVSNATPNTEDTIPHTLGRVPKGYLVVDKDKAGDVYTEGSTAWTDENIYLACSVATVTCKLYVF